MIGAVVGYDGTVSCSPGRYVCFGILWNLIVHVTARDSTVAASGTLCMDGNLSHTLDVYNLFKDGQNN